MNPLARLDHAHVWHPFTQMRDWLRREPVVIVAGQGAVLRDVRGREYLDANASIWTNLHGHRHPKLNAAIRHQLNRISHSSALGLANEPAARLAARLANLAHRQPPIVNLSKVTPHRRSNAKLEISDRKLAKVFFSDDGSTALEVALKLAYEFTRRTRGAEIAPKIPFARRRLSRRHHRRGFPRPHRPFHAAYGGMLFATDQVMAPYCYRCPFNRAKPDRADARKYRQCGWECVGLVERKLAAQKKKGKPYAAFVFEPLMQGAAGMIPQPSGWLGQVTDRARKHGALLIADEVMTGFGRTGVSCHVDDQVIAASLKKPAAAPLFACARVGVQPDFLCLAKGLTGGYLPMAATLTTPQFLMLSWANMRSSKLFFTATVSPATSWARRRHWPAWTFCKPGNPCGHAPGSSWQLGQELQTLWSLPNVGDIRQVGSGRRHRTGQGLANAPAVCRARTGRHPRLRSHGPARRADPPRRRCHCIDAALLHHASAIAADGRRPRRQCEGNIIALY
jgi:adenosylmethionine-8-amino-7-oxononanoate aminotransferase